MAREDPVAHLSGTLVHMELGERCDGRGHRGRAGAIAQRLGPSAAVAWDRRVAAARSGCRSRGWRWWGSGREGAALGSVGEAGGAAEVEGAGAVDDDAVADDDAGDVAFAEAAAQHVEGVLDGESPVDRRGGRSGRSGRRERRQRWPGLGRGAALAPAASWWRRSCRCRGLGGVAVPVRSPDAGGRVLVPTGRGWRAVAVLSPGRAAPGGLALDRVVGRVWGCLFGEELLGGGEQSGVEPHAGLRVEAAVEAPLPSGSTRFERAARRAVPGGSDPVGFRAAPRRSARGAARRGTGPWPGGPPHAVARSARPHLVRPRSTAATTRLTGRDVPRSRRRPTPGRVGGLDPLDDLAIAGRRRPASASSARTGLDLGQLPGDLHVEPVQPPPQASAGTSRGHQPVPHRRGEPARATSS